MHRDPIENLGAADRLPLFAVPSTESLLDPERDAGRDGADDSSPSTRKARAARPASLLTPAVERVLAWHHRRAM